MRKVLKGVSIVLLSGLVIELLILDCNYFYNLGMKHKSFNTTPIIENDKARDYQYKLGFAKICGKVVRGDKLD